MSELSRRQREKLRHRREMLEAAEELFAGGGYHNTTMQEIAEKADFSVGALYHLFDSKEDLYIKLVEMRMNDYLQLADTKLDDASGPLEKVRTLIATKLQFFREHRRFFLIFSHQCVKEGGAGHPVVSREFKDKYVEYQERIRGVFQDGVEEEVFVDGSPLLMALCLEGATNEVIGRWIHTGAAELADVSPEDLEKLLLSGFLNPEGKNEL